MMKKVLLTLLCLLIYLVTISANDSVKILDDCLHLHFKGIICQHGNDTLYQGIMVDSQFIYKSGVFSKDFSYQRYVTYFDDNSILWGKHDKFSKQKFCLYDNFFGIWDNQYDEKLRQILKKDNVGMSCMYNPTKKEWFYGGKYSNDPLGICKKNGKYIAIKDKDDEFFVKYVLYGGLIWFFVFWILYVITKVIQKEQNTSFWAIILVMIISLFLVIILYYVLPEDILCYQFLLPLMLFFVVGLSQGFHLNKYTVSVCLLCLIIFFYENFFTKGNIFIGTQNTEVKWKPGTGIVKRLIIRTELKRLYPTEIENRHGVKSISLVGVKPIKQVTYSAVMGEYFWWIYCLIPSTLDFPLTQIECRIFLERLQEITSLNGFDMLRIEEIEQIVNEPWFEYDKDLKERTSTLYRDSIPLNSEKFIYSYSDVAYLDSINFSILKGGSISGTRTTFYIPIINSTFRLAFRKDGTNARRFIVHGIKIPISSKDNIPDTIIVKKLNGKTIDSVFYDKFQEQAIEAYYDDRIIEYYTLDNNLPRKIFQNAKCTDYIFIPIFEYK